MAQLKAAQAAITGAIVATGPVYQPIATTNMEQSNLAATAKVAEMRSSEAIFDKLINTLRGEPSREWLTMVAQALGENATDSVATYQRLQADANVHRGKDHEVEVALVK